MLQTWSWPSLKKKFWRRFLSFDLGGVGHLLLPIYLLTLLEPSTQFKGLARFQKVGVNEIFLFPLFYLHATFQPKKPLLTIFQKNWGCTCTLCTLSCQAPTHRKKGVKGEFEYKAMCNLVIQLSREKRCNFRRYVCRYNRCCCASEFL